MFEDVAANHLSQTKLHNYAKATADTRNCPAERSHLSLLFLEYMFVSLLPQSILFLLLLAGVRHCLGVSLAGSGCGRLGVLALELLWHPNSCSSAEKQEQNQNSSTGKSLIKGWCQIVI